jgi:hypothetical protein
MLCTGHVYQHLMKNEMRMLSSTCRPVGRSSFVGGWSRYYLRVRSMECRCSALANFAN